MGTEDETGDRLIEGIRRHWPMDDTTAAETVIRLYRLRDILWTRDNAEARRAGLTWGEFEALAALRSGGPPFQMTPGDINGLMLVTSGGLTKILHGLESKGLVRRADNRADGRSCFIELTGAGRKVIEALVRSFGAASGRLFASALGAAERRRFLRSLEKLTRAGG